MPTWYSERPGRFPVAQCALILTRWGCSGDTAAMAGDEDVVRRAETYLNDRSAGPKLPELRRETFGDVGHEISCDAGCDYVAVGENSDGWVTPAVTVVGSSESIPSYTICEPCKDSWERGDWDYLVDQCARGDIVADLAFLSSEVDAYEKAIDDWHRGHDYDPWGRLPARRFTPVLQITRDANAHRRVRKLRGHETHAGDPGVIPGRRCA
jgi:hypothetical protein